MDRNYFLSYGRIIAFLLLLPAIGKLNAKDISNTMDGLSETLHYTDIINQDLQTNKVNNFTLPAIVTGSDYQNRIGEICMHIDCKNDMQLKSFPIVDDNEFSVFFQKNISVVRAWNEWMGAVPIGHISAVLSLQKTNTFEIPSTGLVDGFKFIIKIPDKLLCTSK
ncbi:hypothetical protein EGI16_18460 [Chryseobacterium sp. G0240]|uniref:hypothetical protein n=1 Tax=Chryseobacterium sp. G0240 TaxID=2487066 RepID=UPI000F450C21|nr:hypothetical protein [Chryseobacterium sp. G0240]ROI01167.1 hypothetical protein EGI16_18460 [Chryseobacterium sp. G0240]